MSAVAVIQKEYTLGKGGLVSIGGIIYKPGASIWLTDEEYEAASYRSRLTLVSEEGRVVRNEGASGTAALSAAVTVDTSPTAPSPVTPRSVSAPDPPPPPPPPDLSRAVEAAQAKAAALAAVRDWDAFVANATTESLITYIQDSTSDEIKAIREAEKGRGKQKRVKVVSAANAALRRINMAKARATRDKNLAARRAAEAEAAASSGAAATE